MDEVLRQKTFEPAVFFSGRARFGWHRSPVAGKLSDTVRGVAEVNLENVRQTVLSAYRRNAAELARTANSIASNPCLAEDVVQETFLRYFLSLSHGEKIKDERAWLHRVMRNLLTDWVRSAQVRTTVPLEDVAAPLAEVPSDRTVPSRLQWLKKAAEALGNRERQCIHLRAQGLEYCEIASEMKIRPGTVGALLNSAIRKLRQTAEMSEGLP